MNMKKTACLIISAIMILALSACGQDLDRPQQDDTANNNAEEIPNPFTSYNTVEEAARDAGFGISVPENFGGYDIKSVQAVKDEMIEVIFENGNGDDISVRKAHGTGDISGVYNEYEQSGTVSGDSFEISIKGNGGMVNLATWADDGYTYAVYTDMGLSSDAMLELMAMIK